MTDYINRHDALNIDDLEIECEPDEIELIMRGMAIYADHIKSLPVVPVEPVVRCRECVHYLPEWQDVASTVYQCSCGLGWPEPDDYCYRGKRKEADHE